MHPILFAWRGIVVHSYHVVIYAALLIAVFLTAYFAQAAGLDPDRSAMAVLLLYVPGFIGARLLYVARHWDHFGRDPALILRRSEGGLSLSGGLIGVFAGVVPVLWLLGLSVAPFLDAIVIGMVGGLVVAKGACLLNGCCFGRPTDHWCGLHLPDEGGHWRRRFPSQLIEMAWAAIVFLLLLALRGLSPPPSIVACAGIAVHPLGRILLQRLRDESDAENAAVQKTSLMLSGAAMLAAVLVWLW